MKVFNHNVNILGDDEGFITLECPYCKSEFKLSASDLQDRGDIYHKLYCPYCGLKKETKSFYTREIKAKATRLKREQNQKLDEKSSMLDRSSISSSLSSSRALDMSFSSMNSSFKKKEAKYSIKLDNKKLQKINVSRLKGKKLEEALYKCSICSCSEKVLSDDKTIFYCSYCGVSL